MIRLVLSGLEPLVATNETNFINVGERTNVTGSKKFLDLIRNEDYDGALAIARQRHLHRAPCRVRVPSDPLGAGLGAPDSNGVGVYRERARQWALVAVTLLHLVVVVVEQRDNLGVCMLANGGAQPGWG